MMLGRSIIPDSIGRHALDVTSIIKLGDELGQGSGPVHCRDRLGGTLRYYYRDAA